MFVESRSVTCQSSHNFAQLFSIVSSSHGVDVDAVAAAAVAVVSMKVLSFLHKTKN